MEYYWSLDNDCLSTQITNSVKNEVGIIRAKRPSRKMTLLNLTDSCDGSGDYTSTFSNDIKNSMDKTHIISMKFSAKSSSLRRSVVPSRVSLQKRKRREEMRQKERLNFAIGPHDLNTESLLFHVNYIHKWMANYADLKNEKSPLSDDALSEDYYGDVSDSGDDTDTQQKYYNFLPNMHRPIFKSCADGAKKSDNSGRHEEARENSNHQTTGSRKSPVALSSKKRSGGSGGKPPPRNDSTTTTDTSKLPTTTTTVDTTSDTNFLMTQRNKKFSKAPLNRKQMDQKLLNFTQNVEETSDSQEIPPHVNSRYHTKKFSAKPTEANSESESAEEEQTSRRPLSYDRPLRKMTLTLVKNHGLLNYRDVDVRHIKYRNSLITSVEQVRRFESQRDREWLQFTGPEDDVDEDLDYWESRRYPITSGIQPDLQAFLDSQKWLLRAMTMFGIHPYDYRITPHKSVQVVWANSFWKKFVLYFLTAFYFGAMLSIISSITTIWVDESTTKYENVMRLEFEKYMLEGFWMILIMLFLSIWGGAIIFEVGKQNAEFMSRLNYSISWMKYNVTDGISRKIRNRLVGIAVFQTCFVLLVVFGQTWVPVAHEICGFIALLILSPFFSQLRIKPVFVYCKYFGCFVVIITITLMTLVVLQFYIVIQTIANMSKRFNMRVGYRLRKIGYQTKRSKGILQLYRHVPLKKLYSERLIISSLVKHMSQVNAIVFHVFMIVSGGEMVLILYGNSRYLNGTQLQLDSSYEASPYKLPVPLRVSEHNFEIVFRNILYFVYFLCGTLDFLDLFHRAGHVYGLAMNFFQRHGLTLCTSSKERRFILSVLNADIPKMSMYVGIGNKFPFNRQFVFSLLATALFFWALAMSYSPQRLFPQQFTICTSNGSCKIFRFSRVHEPKYFQFEHTEEKKVYKLPPAPENPGTEVDETESKNTTKLPFKMGNGSSLHEETLPCGVALEEGSMVPQGKSLWSFMNPPGKLIPFVYHKKGSHFEKIMRDLKEETGQPVLDGKIAPYPRFTPESLQAHIAAGEDFYDCGGRKKIVHGELDDCGNPLVDYFSGGKMHAPKFFLLLMETLGGIGSAKSNEYLCCYQYESTLNHVKRCNMQRVDLIRANCKETKDPARKENINKLIEARKDAHNNGKKDPLQMVNGKEFWTDCICLTKC